MVCHLFVRQLFFQRRDAGLLGEHLTDVERFFAVTGEFRPDVSDRIVIGEITARCS
jgi:hypothetical protein